MIIIQSEEKDAGELLREIDDRERQEADANVRWAPMEADAMFWVLRCESICLMFPPIQQWQEPHGRSGGRGDSRDWTRELTHG
jgi:hypothetical protein